MNTAIIRTRARPSLETAEAVGIIHPRYPLKVLFLPKSEIRATSPVEGKPGFVDITIPEWLAEKHAL